MSADLIGAADPTGAASEDLVGAASADPVGAMLVHEASAAPMDILLMVPGGIMLVLNIYSCNTLIRSQTLHTVLADPTGDALVNPVCVGLADL